jgi:uncharacterized protein YbcI
MTKADVEHPSKEHGAVLTEISDGMVALLKEYYGVGPTQAKTYYHDDLVVCVLRGGFTRVEQTLRDGDRGRAVIEQRMAFQEVMRQRFEAVVQHATSRPVIGFMSGNQQEPDMICEVFVLAPTDLVDEHEIRAAGEARSEPANRWGGNRGDRAAADEEETLEERPAEERHPDESSGNGETPTDTEIQDESVTEEPSPGEAPVPDDTEEAEPGDFRLRNRARPHPSRGIPS